jgi:hypothetical protein
VKRNHLRYHHCDAAVEPVGQRALFRAAKVDSTDVKHDDIKP